MTRKGFGIGAERRVGVETSARSEHDEAGGVAAPHQEGDATRRGCRLRHPEERRAAPAFDPPAGNGEQFVAGGETGGSGRRVGGDGGDAAGSAGLEIDAESDRLGRRGGRPWSYRRSEADGDGAVALGRTRGQTQKVAGSQGLEGAGEIARSLERAAVRGDQEIARFEAGGGSGRGRLDRLDDDARRQRRDRRAQRRGGTKAQAEMRPGEVAVGEQTLGDARDHLDRQRQADADVPAGAVGDGDVHGDDAALGVDQRATGGSRIERRIVLDEVVGRGLVEGTGRARHVADGQGRGEAEGIADRRDGIATTQGCGRSDGDRRRIDRDPQHGDVGQLVDADHPGGNLVAVGQTDADLAQAGDDMGGGDDDTAGPQHEAGTAIARPAGAPTEDADAGRIDPLGRGGEVDHRSGGGCRADAEEHRDEGDGTENKHRRIEPARGRDAKRRGQGHETPPQEKETSYPLAPLRLKFRVTFSVIFAAARFMTEIVIFRGIVGEGTICEIVSADDGDAVRTIVSRCFGGGDSMAFPTLGRAGAIGFVSAVILGCVSIVPASAGETGDAAPLGQLALSARLAAWGRADKNPLALIVAAEIRQRLGARAVERTPEQSGETASTAPAASETTVDGLLGEAVALAGKDETIKAFADDVRASATKGLVLGAGMSRATVRAAGTDWYRKLKFEGSRYAETYVELSGSGSVHVSVYDEAGNLVCRDPNPSAVAYCGWTPSRTALFDVKVENRSTTPVPYRMFTN